MDIDFVVTWVDMDDPKWQAEFAKYSGKKENTKNGVSKARFRDYGFLKYWFRGIENLLHGYTKYISSQVDKNPNGLMRTILKLISLIIKTISLNSSFLHITQ